jgi:hypothetical protein
MPFSEEPRTYSETRSRTSTQYVKFSPEYRVVLRILNTGARTIWKHWIPQANGGKGFGVNCPNTSSQVRPCPIDKMMEGLSDDDPKRGEYRARRRFVVNVLDRTPHATCDSCGNLTPGKKCQFCGANLSKAEFQPLNQVKILEGGPELFNKTLNPIEKMYKEDHDVDISGYDITFMTQGVGRERQIAATPMTPAELSADAFIDAEGKEQKLFDLDLLAEPTTVEEIEAFLRGATIKEVNELRGVAS